MLMRSEVDKRLEPSEAAATKTASTGGGGQHGAGQLQRASGEYGFGGATAGRRASGDYGFEAPTAPPRAKQRTGSASKVAPPRVKSERRRSGMSATVGNAPSSPVAPPRRRSSGGARVQLLGGVESDEEEFLLDELDGLVEGAATAQQGTDRNAGGLAASLAAQGTLPRVRAASPVPGEFDGFGVYSDSSDEGEVEDVVLL